MDFASNYEIARTADFILSRNFTRVALQFPDELLKDSIRVVSDLRNELHSLSRETDGGDDTRNIGLYVMADTTYGSCCVDEVGASHVDADCVVHYGHTCLSPTSTLPALFVFGKAPISISDCVKSLSDCLSTSNKPVLVLFGLEYAHAIHSIKESLSIESSTSCGPKAKGLYFADIVCSVINPSENCETASKQHAPSDSDTVNGCTNGCKQTGSNLDGTKHAIGGLTWNLPHSHSMDDYMLFWIGSDNPAFANVVLTYNSSEIVRYDTVKNSMLNDVSHQKRILKRRYYLVEKAKDANIIGILVGTLGVAGYLNMINQMKALIAGAGKKAYTLLMGRPNPAKLANFPECDVFIYVSCAQTALLDSKEFLAPVITPFEAMLAFNRGSQWTGKYVIGFRDLITSAQFQVAVGSEEPRFSFLQGGYVEDFEQQETENGSEENERATDLAEATQKSLQLREKYYPNSLVKGTAKSGAEFFSSRSYHGLEMQSDDALPRSFIVGRTGKASGYKDERNKQGDS